MRKRIALVLLLGLLLHLFALPVLAEWDPAEAQKKRLIREMVCSFGLSYGYTERVDYLMAELKKTDLAAARKWKEILDYWKYANKEMRVRKRLPGDLPDDNTLCIVVMGYQLGSNGAIQEELLGRLQAALKAAEKYPNAYILCTGGCLGGTITEAGQMEWWLTQNGVDPERIIKESHATSTVENVINSMQILREDYPEVTNLAIVSSDYHVKWSTVLFQTACILASKNPQKPDIAVVSNASSKTVYGNNISPWENQWESILAIAGLV